MGCTQRGGFVLLFLLLICLGCDHPQKQAICSYERSKQQEREKLLSLKDTTVLQSLFAQGTEANNQLRIMLCGRALGDAYKQEYKYDQAVTCYQRSVKAAVELRDTLEMAKGYNCLATACLRIGIIAEASAHYYKALALTEAYSYPDERQNLQNRIVALQGIGDTYLELRLIEEAKSYFLQAQRWGQNLEDLSIQAHNDLSLGTVYKEQKQYEKAKEYYRASLKSFQSLKDKKSITLCYIHLGDVEKLQNNDDAAYAHYITAYNKTHQAEDHWERMEAALALAQIELYRRNYASAFCYLQEAQEDADQLKAPIQMQRVYELQVLYYKGIRNYEEALRASELYIALRSRMAQLRYVNSLQDTRISYEREKQQQEILHLKQQHQQQQQIERMVFSTTMIILLLSFFLLAALSYAHQQSRKRNRLLKQIEEMRSAFFTGLTHEFRTPIAVIQGINDRIDHSPNLSAEDRHSLHSMIARQSALLLVLVNQLLEMTKLRSGVSVPDWNHGNIVLYLRMLIEPFELLAIKKEVVISLQTPAEEVWVDFVPSYLQKIVGNLLSNALKHSPHKGTIEVILSLGKNHKTYTIEVWDQGAGIALEDQKYIFDDFYRTPQSEGLSGFGVGLSFTRLLVNSLKGTIEMRNVPKSGCCFSVVLPANNSENPKEKRPWIPQGAEKFAAAQSVEKLGDESMLFEVDGVEPAAPSTILVVEDNKDIECLIKLVLSNAYSIITAPNGKEGLQKAIEWVPDLIITDITMPVMDGFEMIQQIRQLAPINHIPIIALTARVSDQDRIKAFRCGIDVFMIKPFNPEELLVHIERIFTNRELLKEHYAQQVLSVPYSVSPSMQMGLGIDATEGGKDADDRNVEFLLRVNKVIEEEVYRNGEFSSQDLADKLCLSLSQLNRKLSGLTGHPSQTYIQQVKIKRACELLLSSSEPIAEIGAMVGFADPSYFARFFKKHMGQTPMQYRKQYVVSEEE